VGRQRLRANLPRFSVEARQANQALVDRVSAVAEGKGVSTGQGALAWLLAQKPWIVPIPGSRRPTRLEENIGSTSVELTSDDLAQLDEASTAVTIIGDR
jgi:aryl-alcohol dehydrogenase-like predicted oxidoreductase